MLNAITGNEVSLYDFLKPQLSTATEIKIIVSFIMESGAKLLVDDLRKCALKGIPIKILTGTYLGITEPSALYLLKDQLGNSLDLRIFDKANLSFHPKTYILDQKEDGVIFIGSSNISRSALTDGIEWNYRLNKSLSPKDYDDFSLKFDELFQHESIKVTHEILNQYAVGWKKHRPMDGAEAKLELVPTGKIEPRGAQIEALYELKRAREEGVDKGIVIAATGVGKTYISAFDSLEYKRILFVAHREEILKQAEQSFKKLRISDNMGFFNSSRKDMDCDIVFAMIQTLGKEKYLTDEYFPPDYFDYIVMDEFHHAAANSYQGILKYFTPKFLLGLTATPYRMDHKDIFSLCEDNIIYEIHLKDAINRDLLVPFKYYGIYDKVDYDKIEYKNGKYNTEQLEKALSNNERAEFIYRHYNNFRKSRTLGFCSSIKHAEYMADYFNKKGIKAAIVHSNTSDNEYKIERDEAIKKLENRQIEIIFAIDIFNEGVDIPSIDSVLFLRPTESYVVFLQQLGRGLRKSEGKDYLTVLDFIGNYKRAHYIPRLLAGENPLSSKRRTTNYDTLDFPEGCYVNFDFALIDLFKEMSKRDPLEQRMKDEYFRLKDLLKRRPTRVDLYNGSDIGIREYIKKGYLRFLESIDDLTDEERLWLNTDVETLLAEVEKTSMVKSYKVPIFLSMLEKDKIKSKVSVEELGKTFMDFYKNNKLHTKDFNNDSNKDWMDWDIEKYTKLALKNPVHFLSKGKFFNYDEINGCFHLTLDIDAFNGQTLKDHWWDILELRRKQYFNRRFRKDAE